MGVEKEIGAIIAEKTGTPVRLKDPAFELHIEIGQRHMYIFSEKIRGFGGFPVGSAGKLVSLISGRHRLAGGHLPDDEARRPAGAAALPGLGGRDGEGGCACATAWRSSPPARSSS